MPGTRVSRRSILAAAGAAVPAAAAAQQAPRQPVATPAMQIASAQRPSSEPLRILLRNGNTFDATEVEQIRKAGEEFTRVEIIVPKDANEFRMALPTAEVVYGNVSAAELDSAPKLKWLQNGAAGMESTPPQVMQSKLTITNYARTFSYGITETAMGFLLALTRGMVRYYLPQFYLKKTMRSVGNSRSDHHIELVGKTMGIVGMGGIGSLMARRAHNGFDMRVIGVDAKPIPKPDYVAEIHDASYFMKMVPQVDVLVAAVPQTPSTRGMFNEAVFRAMKKSAYFLAMSRGPVYDADALVKVLKERTIAGAGLDVFPIEPVPDNHPIFGCDNVIMTPHTSGWSPDRQVRLTALFAENVRRYAGGLPLINVVDKERGY